MLPRKALYLIAAFSLLLVFVAELAFSVHRQSLSWDEGDHLYAGYQAWKSADFGINPEHPPLVKEVAALPLLLMHLQQPAPHNLPSFKDEAYYDGRDLIFHNGGLARAGEIIFRARMAASVFSLLMAALVFAAGWEFFGLPAGVFALALVVFEPNLIAHGAYVTTDMGVTCFLLATLYALYRYMERPGPGRLLVMGLAAGLALASKHSAVLLLPFAITLLLAELTLAPRGTRLARARTFAGGAAAATAIALVVLWSTYGFRYSAKPGGRHMTPTLEGYIGPLAGHLEARAYLAIYHWHLLPESYIYGLSDVRIVSTTWPSFLFGQVYERGVPSYFVAAFLIKSTAAFLALLALTVVAFALRALPFDRRTLYLLLPSVVYVAFACASGLNIGGRHILPIYPLLAILFAGGVAALSKRHRAWGWAAAVLLGWHIVSTARAYPNTIAYANEFWGGPTQTYRYLTDSNTDWGQQLYSVKRYVDEHNIHQCWFGYFVQPLIDFHDYGIPCQVLPTPDEYWAHMQVDTPTTITGPVFISAGTLTGYELGSAVLNPLGSFVPLKPAASIDDGVFVFNGTFDTHSEAAFGHMTRAKSLLGAKQLDQARAEALVATSLDPKSFQSQMVLGDAAKALGQKQEAQAAYTRALAIAQTMEPTAQQHWVPLVEANLRAQ